MAEVVAQTARDTLKKWILADGFELICDLQRSKGAYLYDAISNVEYLDFYCYAAARPLGFNHPGLLEPDFLERLAKVAVHKPSNCDVYTVEYAEFTEKFCTVALGGEFEHVFFIEGGASAVENAVKTAFDWKHRKNLAAGKGEKGSQILHFAEAFHGRHGYCLSLTDSHDPRKTQYFPKFDWPRVINPKMRFPFDDGAKAATEELEANALAEIDAAFDSNPDDIAAILIEPVQGEGGDNYFRGEFLQQLRDIADEREALLIFDEIQTGFGATGKWWDWQNHQVKPDLMAFGKKAQVSGFAATARVDEVEGVFRTPSRISSTFEGNLVDMVRCQRIIEIIEEEDLLGNAQSMGMYLEKVIQALAAQHEQLSNVRGRGMWAAFDLPTPQERDKVVAGCFREELLLLPSGTHSVRLRPALDTDADAVGRCAAQLEAGIRRAY